MKRYWRIRGYEGTAISFEKVLPLGLFTSNQMRGLLKALLARFALLNFDEIIGAYAKRGTRFANVHLDVYRENPASGSFGLWCGDNPSFTADVVDENGRIIRRVVDIASSRFQPAPPA